MWPFTRNSSPPPLMVQTDHPPRPTPAKVRRPTRRYKASVLDRLDPTRPSNLSANSLINDGLVTLRNRSRALERDNEYAKKYFNMLMANVVGTHGIKLQAQARDEKGNLDRADNQLIEETWQDWSQPQHCSATRNASWIDIQNLAITTIARDGEVLIQLLPGFKNDYKFALEVIESDYLDETYNINIPGKRVVMGVEVDEWGAAVAYNLLTTHPGEGTHLANSGKRYRRVLAENIIHLYKTERPGQVRGVPWMHAVMTRLNQIDGYMEAELIAARTAASKMGFYQSETGDGFEGHDTQANGDMITDAEPGAFEELPPGVTFTPYDPQHPTTAFRPFMATTLRGTASGLNVAYETLSSDREGVNFSSIRSGVIDERDQWKTLQKWLSIHLHERVYRAWLKQSITVGKLDLPPRKFEKFKQVLWQPRGWTWVDPLKDQNAQRLAVEMGTQTLTNICAAEGRDFEEVCAQREREKKTQETYGLTPDEVIENAKTSKN